MQTYRDHRTRDGPDPWDECSREVRASVASVPSTFRALEVPARAATAQLPWWHRWATNPPWSGPSAELRYHREGVEHRSRTRLLRPTYHLNPFGSWHGL